ncbi:hypothetical protein M405DRAFT_603213 [Rhizopogon salebrosus TDB-379]|nr:hypothetical protein M405DRAFT_603213 [Rhizopogon salebrosus TDB-379]
MMCGSSGEPKICQGKLLFSASDDGSIRLWDLARRTCVRVSIIRHCLIGQLRCPQSTAAVLTMASPCRIPVSTEMTIPFGLYYENAATSRYFPKSSLVKGVSGDGFRVN